MEESGSIENRVRGGWIDRHCNLLFGNRRGPVTVRFGEFGVIRGQPIQFYYDDHRNRFFVQWSPRDGEWQHYQYRSTSDEWRPVPRSTVADATNWWLSHDKLHRTIRSLLMDGSSDDISITTIASGRVVLRAVLDHTYVHMRSFLPNRGDRLDFVLELDPESHAVRGFEWTLHRAPDVNPNACLTYQEIASDVKLGVPFEQPDEALR